MKKYTKNIGLILIILGALTLVATRFSNFSTHNGLLSRHDGKKSPKS